MNRSLILALAGAIIILVSGCGVKQGNPPQTEVETGTVVLRTKQTIDLTSPLSAKMCIGQIFLMGADNSQVLLTAEPLEMTLTEHQLIGSFEFEVSFEITQIVLRLRNDCGSRSLIVDNAFGFFSTGEEIDYTFTGSLSAKSGVAELQIDALLIALSSAQSVEAIAESIEVGPFTFSPVE